MQNLITVFLTGLLTGGLTCMAVQGGLLMATLAQTEESKLREKAKGGNALPIISFLVAKLTAYTILGFLLGLLGSFFQLSVQFRAILIIAVSVFMLGTAFNILEVHPIFRYFIIQPPKFICTGDTWGFYNLYSLWNNPGDDGLGNCFWESVFRSCNSFCIYFRNVTGIFYFGILCNKAWRYFSEKIYEDCRFRNNYIGNIKFK